MKENKETLFTKQKFENKDKVSQFKEQFANNQIDFNDLPKDVLIELLYIAVEKIDECENVCEDFEDERDWKDALCDKEFVVDDLFTALEEKIKLDIYE